MLVNDVNTTNTLISSGDLNFSAAGGFRVGAGFCLCNGWTLEAQFLGGLNHVATSRVTGVNNLALPGDLGLSVNNFFLADEVDVRYESNLNSPEINFVCCCCCCDNSCCGSGVCDSCEYFVGLRYIDFSEELAIRSNDLQEGISTYRVRTYNNLYGGQIGLRRRRCWGRWSLEGTGKAGIYANDASQVQDPIYDFPNIQYRSRREAEDTVAAFAGELNLSGIYHINDIWGIRGGYNLLWIEGVALAPDQLDFTDTALSGTTIDTNGSVFFHGASIGLEARY
ncbi:MAG: BBP7 family outer membrane beta-barrel protein [Planctomycetales bacterium]|nr:BBP7 family outer membrane beta-barrel protein [Planctomycetales bacterium]